MYKFNILFPLLFFLAIHSINAQITPEIAHESTKAWLINKLTKRQGNLDSLNAIISDPNIYLFNSSSNLIEESNLSESVHPESEVHAAINPTDTNNIIVASMQFSPGLLGSELKIPIFYTNDFGNSWNSSSFTPTEIGVGILDLVAGGGDPVLAFTPDGKAHLTWLLLVTSLLSGESNFIIHHAVSNDGGATWIADEMPIDAGAVEIITDNFPEVSIVGRAVDKEWLAVDSSPSSPYYGSLYASYVELTIDEIAHYQIMLSAWDGDESFSSPVVAVDSLNFFLSQFVTPAVSQNGDLHLSWLGVSNDDFYLGIYHTKSTDGGESFSTPQLVSYINVPCFPPMTSTEPCIPGVDADRTLSYNYILAGNTETTADHLYITWSANGFQEEVTSGFDIYFSKSVDGGETWSIPQIVNQDLDININNFMSYPSLSPNGTLFLSWYDQRESIDGTITDYYGSYSNDNGNSFTDDFKISCIPTNFSTVGSLNSGFGVGEYNATVSTPNQIIPFWSDGRLGNGNLDIFYAKIPNNESVPTSIQTIQSASFQLEISPNPAQYFLNATIYTDEKLENVELIILDAQGKLIERVKVNSIIGNDKSIELAIPDATGTYFLLVNTNKGRVIKSFSVI